MNKNLSSEDPEKMKQSVKGLGFWLLKSISENMYWI